MAVKCQFTHGETAEQASIRECVPHIVFRVRGFNRITTCYGYSIRQRPIPGDERDVIYCFSEYCAGGTLHDLINRHRANGKPIPEALIWIIFRAVAESIYSWNTGKVCDWEYPSEENSDAPNDALEIRGRWQRFTNLDISINNVCLGKPNVDYPAFPSVKVIDFGSLYRGGPDIETGEGMGTSGVMAPVSILVPIMSLCTVTHWHISF